MAFDFNNRGNSQRSTGSPPSPPQYEPETPSKWGGESYKENRNGSNGGGFHDAPKRADSLDVHSYPGSENGYEQPAYRQRVKPPIRKPRRRRTPPVMMDIPWKFIIIVMIVIGVIALIYTNRYLIENFLAQVISWVLVIALALLLIRYIFRGGR